MTRRAALAAGLLGALSSAAAALAARPAPPSPPKIDAPSFAGRWALDVAASDFGKRGRVPRSRIDEIREDSGWVAVHEVSARAEADTLRLDFRYRANGEAVNTVAGQEVRTRAKRDGGSLRLESTAKFLLMQIRQSEHWKLSADRKTLTIDRESHSPLGDDTQRLVFRRLE